MGKEGQRKSIGSTLGNAEEFEKYFVVDTSALEHNEIVFEKLRENGRNCIIMPYATWEELDSHKTRNDFKANIARNVIRSVRKLMRARDGSVMFLPHDFKLAKNANLKKDKNDHCIIATALKARREFRGKKVILVTQDIALETMALHFDLDVQPVEIDRTKGDQRSTSLRTINIQREWIKDGYFSIDLLDDTKAEALSKVNQNEGIVCYSDVDGKWKPAFAAVRKKEKFRIVDNNISLWDVRPKANNGDVNWAQYIAMDLLKDPNIPIITLTGEAGTAKTFLALLAAFEQKSQFKKILVSRATIQLGDKDRLGFTPGDIKAKMMPWMLPIFDNIAAIKELVPKKEEIINKCLEENKLELMELDKIRGRSIQRSFVIVDEIQNLPPAHVKAIATRIAEGSRIVFTGDFSGDQIDVPWLDERSNGLSVLNSKMSGSELFGTVYLDQAIRSPLVKEILKRW